MKLGLRVFLGYFLALGLAAWLGLRWIENELSPLVRQASEEALVETAYVLAAALQPGLLAEGQVPAGQTRALAALAGVRLQALIWGNHKQQLDLRVHVTDAAGKVLFDSSGLDEGKDFSRWNDIYLTLRGEYGVRSTRTDPDDPLSSVMHVAAPVREGERLLGVVSVSMPNTSTEHYLRAARQRLQGYGALALLGSLAIGVLFTGWLIASLRRIGDYAEHASDRAATLPTFARGTELEKLASAIDSMRAELEGHHHLERYVQHLTHELKSPLSVIRASNELLADAAMPQAQREQFVSHVEQQCGRLQDLADRLLQLIRLEQKRQLDQVVTVALLPLLQEQISELEPKSRQRQLRLQLEVGAEPAVSGDPFLLALAVRNLLENALQFADTGSVIVLALGADAREARVEVRNQGPTIPEYALARLGERFYCLPHPDGSQGSGLGLALVKEVVALHRGHFLISNTDAGVLSGLCLPLA